MTAPHNADKGALAPLRAAMYDFDTAPVRAALVALLSDGAAFRLSNPIGEGAGPEVLCDRAYRDLYAAWPDLERRDTIVIAGQDADGADWVGCCGYYTGTFARPWLDIPPTGHQVAMRFHEFYRFERGKVAEIQALWDIPEVMMQARVWPLGPSLGRDWQVPGPATQDGLGPHGRDALERGQAAARHVKGMLEHMARHPSQGGPEVMQMDRFWHPRMNWYGPAGIGTARGIAGFRNWHQIPFLNAMPDRGQLQDGIDVHLFGEGDYVGVTGWPNMRQTLSHPGWLGLPPTGQQITLRSLDFWRLENGLIRENWVLVDLLDVYAQLGVDVLGRMREFNKARAGFDPDTGRAQ